MKKGNRVICVDASGDNDLIKGREYIIYNVKKCKCTINFDVGLKAWSGSACYDCATILSDPQETHWFNSRRFAIAKEKTRYVTVAIEKELLEQELILNSF